MSYTRTALDLLGRVFTTRINVDRARGYDDVASVARVAPLAIIGDDLKHYEGTADVSETALNLVTSYYLKALPMSQEIGGAQVIKTLRRMSPDPKYKLNHRNTWDKAKGLIGLGLLDHIEESKVYDDFIGLKGENFGLENTQDVQVNVKDGKDLDLSAIEKNVLVEIKTSEAGVTSVPLTLALNVHYVTSLVAVDLLTGVTVEDTFTERYYDWKAGMISASDFIFALDLIEKKKKILIQDDSNILREIQERREAGWAVVAADGFHLGEATNVAIISEQTAKAVASRHRGKISSDSVRDKIFSDLSLMVLAIVDREDEYVTFYYRGVTTPSTHAIKSLKKKNAKGGPDIAEVLKALNSGTKPLF